MNDEILFEENQKFRQLWFWVILIAADLITLYGLIKQISYGLPIGSSLIIGKIAAFAITLLFTGILFILKLETTIKKDGIYIRFYPFHLKTKEYSWNVISRAYVRKYNPIMEYGGWGIRLGMFGKGNAFNVSGNMGIQLVFTNGSMLLIGTKKAGEAEAVLAQIENKQLA